MCSSDLLDQDLWRFDAAGFAPFRAEWETLHAHQNQVVHVLTGQGGRVVGEAVGVDESGAFLLSTADGVRRFHSGEVSVRGGS